MKYYKSNNIIRPQSGVNFKMLNKKSLVLVSVVCLVVSNFLTLSAVNIFAQNSATGLSQIQKDQNRLALVIGNSNYQKVNRLPNSTNDASDMAKALKNLGFDVMLGLDLNQQEMETLINEFGQKLKEKRGVGLFYYAGHGVQSSGVNYIIPTNADIPAEENLKYKAVDLGLLFAKMEVAKNEQNIVILDACRNNPFISQWNNEREISLIKNGLTEVKAPNGTFIAYSTGINMVASDGEGKNGLYTSELLSQLPKKNLKLEEMFKNVRASVSEKSNNKQVPWDSSSFKGEFYFAGKENPKPTPVAIATETPKPVPVPIIVQNPNSVEAEKAYWEEILRRNTVEDFQMYLKEYPSGSFAALARLKIADLNAKNAKIENEKKRLEAEKLRLEKAKEAERIRLEKAKELEQAKLAKAKEAERLKLEKEKTLKAETEKKRLEFERQALEAKAELKRKAEESARIAKEKKDAADKAVKLKLEEDAKATKAKLEEAERLKNAKAEEAEKKRQEKIVADKAKQAATPVVSKKPPTAPAKWKSDRLLFKEATEKNTVESYEQYLKVFPKGVNAKAANAKILELKNAEAERVRLESEAKILETKRKAEAEEAAKATLTEEIRKAKEAEKAIWQNPKIGGRIKRNLKDLEVELVGISSGEFEMGLSDDAAELLIESLKPKLKGVNKNWFANEMPVRSTKVDKGFWIGKYEVTQGQWKAVMGSNPSFFQGSKNRLGGDENLPVENVSWEEAKEFVRKLNAIDTEFDYRLPTEAEWEFVSRAGTIGGFGGNLEDIAWFDDNSGTPNKELKELKTRRIPDEDFVKNFLLPNGNQPNLVGRKNSNKWGLFDMLGNVSEWCEDAADAKSGAPVDSKIIRGGSWSNTSERLRVSARNEVPKSSRSYAIGFRLVAMPKKN